MSRPNLVIARVGGNSIHPTWLASSAPRSWDLYLCPYQTMPPQGDLDLTLGKTLPGPKWTGLRDLLHHWNGWRAYEYIWLPDDDIFASGETINRIFEIAKALSLDLFAPALHESSFYAHFDTMRNQRCFARRTGFAEIMVPGFSVQALDKLLPTFDLTASGWGWGLDSLWPHLLEYRNVGIIDAAPVLHTRPVGQFRDAELDRTVRAESDAIMSRYNCAQVHTTYEVIGDDLEVVELSPEELAATLADGWQYLFPTNPAALPWMMNFQRPVGGWNDYPVSGTPSCAR